MRRSRPSLLAALLVLLVFAASCSVPTDETAQEIDPEELPDVLRPTSTTTTSTLPAPLSETVTVYLLRNPEVEDQPVVVPRERDVLAASGPEAALEPLFGSGLTVVTELEQDDGLFNALDEFALNDVGLDEGVATIDISHIDATTGEPDDAPIGTGLLDVAAQLVFSATEDDRVEAVLIERDGEPLSLPTQTEGGDSEEDQPVDRTDYARYDPTIPVPASSSTTTTAAPA